MRVSEEEIHVLRNNIMDEMDLTRELEDEEVYSIVEEQTGKFAKDRMLTLKEREELEQFLFNSLRKLDVLQELLEDAQITEIMVNGAEHIFYEKNGQLYESGKRFSSKEKKCLLLYSFMLICIWWGLEFNKIWHNFSENLPTLPLSICSF